MSIFTHSGQEQLRQGKKPQRPQTVPLKTPKATDMENGADSIIKD